MTYEFTTTKKRSELMRRIKSINTKPEIAFRRALWSAGVRYRINSTDLPGKPDIVLKKQRIAVFIDGEFWHGFEWEKKKGTLKSNRAYWINKIEGNMARDRQNEAILESNGWRVLRFWETEIKTNLEYCLSKVMTILKGH